MQALRKKIIKTKKILKQAEKKYGFENIALAWKGGKDTTTLMHIILCMYDGVIPYRVMFNDTTLEFPQMYKFIEKVAHQWNLNLLVERHSDEDLANYHKARGMALKEEISRRAKINSLNRALEKYKLKGYMLGIRRDENPARKNEKYFSPRPNHIRIHPLLDFTEEDVWNYIRLFNVPYSPLYDKGYRSIGEKPFTRRSKDGERSGREQNKEKMMEKLRQMGYW